MSRLLPFALAVMAGCAVPFEPPTPSDIGNLIQFPAPPGPYVRARTRFSIESLSFGGVFEGVVLARTGPSPVLRVQLFPDVGGKALDLVARPDRITGYLPHLGEGIDMALPSEARLHLLSLVGVTLLEHLVPVTGDRLIGVQRDMACGYRLRGAAVGVELTAWSAGLGHTRREFQWVHGVRWTELAVAGRSSEISTPRLSARMEVLEITFPKTLPDSLFELKLPDEVKR